MDFRSGRELKAWRNPSNIGPRNNFGKNYHRWYFLEWSQLGALMAASPVVDVQSATWRTEERDNFSVPGEQLILLQRPVCQVLQLKLWNYEFKSSILMINMLKSSTRVFCQVICSPLMNFFLIIWEQWSIFFLSDFQHFVMFSLKVSQSSWIIE